MKIDWFTVAAQIVNFLILVWLLKRFLYRPVLSAIEKREAKIAGQLSDAQAKKTEALEERELFRQKNEEFDQQRAIQLNKVIEEVKDERQKLLEKVRDDSTALRLKLDNALKEDQQGIIGALRQKIQREVFGVVGKTLSDLGSATLEEQIVNVFIQRLNNLGENETKEFKESFNSNNNAIVVKTAFGLSPSKQSDLENSLNGTAGKKIVFQYQVDPGLVCGIELTIKGYTLSWNINEYLEDLEKQIGLWLTSQDKKGENAVH